MTKYQQLKQQALADFPQLSWVEKPGKRGQGHTELPYSRGRTEIVIQYADPSDMLLSSAAHEIGHLLSYLRGYHTEEFKKMTFTFKKMNSMGFPSLFMPEHKLMVIEEEERAWRLGQEYAAQHGLLFDAADERHKEWALSTYYAA